MSEVLSAEAAYRKEVLLGKDAMFMYRHYFVGKLDCCIECVAPQDVIEEYLAVSRKVADAIDGLQDHCGYTLADILDLTDNWVHNVLKDGLKCAADNQEDWFIEKYAANFDTK